MGDQQYIYIYINIEREREREREITRKHNKVAKGVSTKVSSDRVRASTPNTLNFI